MAENRKIVKLDQKLIKTKIIDTSYKSDYKLVHNMLNTHVRKSGKILSEKTFQKGDAKLRSWLMTLYKKGASQEKLTSYLRCGLAHLSFDFVESTYEQIPADDLIARALSSFKLRNFHSNFFKVSQSALDSAKKKSGKKKIVKKKVKIQKPKKTKLIKKTKVNKIVRARTEKKAIRKKTVNKKKVVKKSRTKKKDFNPSTTTKIQSFMRKIF